MALRLAAVTNSGSSGRCPACGAHWFATTARIRHVSFCHPSYMTGGCGRYFIILRMPWPNVTTRLWRGLG